MTIRYHVTTSTAAPAGAWQTVYYGLEGRTLTDSVRVESGYLSVFEVTADASAHDDVRSLLAADAGVTSYRET